MIANMASILAFAPLLFASLGLSQFVPAPTDLITKMGFDNTTVRYKEVPQGICEQGPYKSYAGYIDIGENMHSFFWFFEARNADPTTAPLTSWINGGPGSTSMLGLWQELGPCGVDFAGNPYNNPYSWSNASNMIFIDQPTTVGFSYSKVGPGYIINANTGDIAMLPAGTTECPDYADGMCGTFSSTDPLYTANSTSNAAPYFWKTLQGFMGAFPEYCRDEYHFTTESYGGHYGPIFNEYFLEQNAKNIPNTHPINLKSVMIGNGWYSPSVQYAAYYNFTVYPGNTYDYKPYNQSIESQLYNSLYGPGNCIDGIQRCSDIGTNEVCSLADSFCANYVESVLDNIPDRDEYDIREIQPDPFPYGFFEDYLNTPKVQKAMGAYQNFSTSSTVVGNAFGNTGDDGREEGTIEAMKKLLDQGITVTMYTGDADYNCNWLGGEVVSQMVGQPGFDKAGYTDIKTSDGKTHGQVKQAGRFAFVRVYESGHEVPFYQPLAALEIFERNIAGKDIATGKVPANPGYLTTGTQRSTFREGNSTVQMSVLNPDATYDPTTGAINNSSTPRAKRGLGEPFRKERPTRPVKRGSFNKLLH